MSSSYQASPAICAIANVRGTNVDQIINVGALLTAFLVHRDSIWEALRFCLIRAGGAGNTFQNFLLPTVLIAFRVEALNGVRSKRF